MLMTSLWLLFLLLLCGNGATVLNSIVIVTATTDTTTPVVDGDNDNLCSICNNGQILTKSDTIIPSGTINFIINDISCIHAQIQSIQWTTEQCELVHSTTSTSTLCGCTDTPNNIDISVSSIQQCTGICRKGESITNPNTIIPIGTIKFLSSPDDINYTCQQAQNDCENNSKWTNEQCMMIKQQTNVASICGCTINSRPLLRGGISISLDTTTLPSSDTMRRRRSHTNNNTNNSTADDSSTGSNIFD